MPEKSREELVHRANTLKQRDKLKVFDIIMDAYSMNEDLNNVITQSLIWCDKLCDYKK